ncbi:MAG TPA: N-acetylmuramoyl-L-alanine amidase [Chloroflexia bacterium]
MRSRLVRPAVYLLVVALSLTVAATAFAGKPGPGPTPAPAARIVCVDAGHGGTDPGAVYSGLQEKDLTLDIAYRLRDLLVGAGYKVVMTRAGDQALGNSERADLCNAGGADTVLSIHLNASSDPNVDYFKAFYGKQNKDQAFTQTIWQNYNLGKPNSTVPLSKSSTTQFASGLLLKATAPACLAETVFLSNPAEAALLGDGSGTRQQEIAQNLFNGLAAWYAGR